MELLLPDAQAAPLTSAPLEALWEIYPMTLSRLEEAESHRLVQEFYRWRRSHARGTLAQLFPLFLGDRKWPARNGFLPTLAETEWHIYSVQHEAEVPTRGFERVNLATDDEWASARFEFDPGHRLITSEWWLPDIFANLEGEHGKRPGRFLVFRNQGPAKLKALKDDEAQLIEALDLGVPLGVIQDRNNGPEFNAFLFQSWMETGFLRAIHWRDAAFRQSLPV